MRFLCHLLLLSIQISGKHPLSLCNTTHNNACKLPSILILSRHVIKYMKGGSLCVREANKGDWKWRYAWKEQVWENRYDYHESNVNGSSSGGAVFYCVAPSSPPPRIYLYLMLIPHNSTLKTPIWNGLQRPVLQYDYAAICLMSQWAMSIQLWWIRRSCFVRQVSRKESLNNSMMCWQSLFRTPLFDP